MSQLSNGAHSAWGTSGRMAPGPFWVYGDARCDSDTDQASMNMIGSPPALRDRADDGVKYRSTGQPGAVGLVPVAVLCKLASGWAGFGPGVRDFPSANEATNAVRSTGPRSAPVRAGEVIHFTTRHATSRATSHWHIFEDAPPLGAVPAPFMAELLHCGEGRCRVFRADAVLHR